MTKVMGDDINQCYSLLFTAEGELRNGCQIKALLCFENCRKLALSSIEANPIYVHCLFRAARKESQLLRGLGLEIRAYKRLKTLSSRVKNPMLCLDVFFVYVQLYDLSLLHEPKLSEDYFYKMNDIADFLNKEA